jgi:hypothetical protein
MREQIGHDGDEVFGHFAKAVNGTMHQSITLKTIAILPSFGKKGRLKAVISGDACPQGACRRGSATRGAGNIGAPIDRPMPVASARRWIEEFFDGLADFSIKKGHHTRSADCLRALSGQTTVAGVRRHANDLYWTSCLLLCAADAIVLYGPAALVLALPPVAERGKRRRRTIHRCLRRPGCPRCAGRLSASR